MSDLRLPYTKEELLNLLGNIKNEEELREFIQQNSASAGGGHTDEEIRIIVAEWYQANKDAQLTKEDVDGWIAEYLEENPVSGGLTEQQVNAIVEKYIQDNNISGSVSAEEIAQAVENYIAEHPITGVTTEDIQNAVNSYLTEHPVRDGQNGVSPTVEVVEITGGHRVTITDADGPQVFDIMNGKDGKGGSGTVTDEQIASAVQAYLIENPVEGGMTTEQLNTAIADYLANNPITNVDEDTFGDMADEWIENIKIAGANLPVIFLSGDTTDMSKENAVDMTMLFSSQFKTFEEPCTCKWQGTSSIAYPKKNFTVKLENKHGVGWGKQKKYCLKANYIDHSHARNIVSARLWSQVVSSRSDYADMPELLQSSPNNGAIDGFPVRLYVNEEYQGIYTMNIPKGSWQFGMDDTNENHCILCGENYVSGCFRGSANIDGSDWSDELHDVVPDSVKTRWNEVISFVMNSTDEDFKANITNYIDLQSLIDYYIFAYVSTGLDALGKNQIYYTYDGQKYYASMYDMDSTWGMYYNGQSFVSESYRMQDDYETKVNGRQGNLLYYRVEDLFQDEILSRYNELRESVLSYSNILGEFERFMSCITSEQYSDETSIYSGIPSSTTNNIKQLRSYVKARLSYVDGMMVKVDLTGIELTDNNITVGYTTKLIPTLTPENANTYDLEWSCDNENITISDGSITGVVEGTTVVTVTDKTTGLNASCTITINPKSENGTTFYISKMSGDDGIDVYGNGTKYFYSGDVTTDLPYFVAFNQYIGSGTIEEAQTTASTHTILIASNRELRWSSNGYLLCTQADYTNNSADYEDFEYEVYYAPFSTSKDTENPFAKADNASLNCYRTNVITDGVYQVGFGFGNNPAPWMTNYDLYGDYSKSTLKLAKNYEQSDYE